MHELSPTETSGMEKHVLVQETLRHDGNHIASIEQEVYNTDGRELPAGTLLVRRKVRRKEDGPLALCCEWVVEHQIGTIGHLWKWEID